MTYRPPSYLLNIFIIFILIASVIVISYTLYITANPQFPSGISSTQPTKVKPPTILEKIKNLSIQEFDSNLTTYRVIDAETYIKYKGLPAILINPVIHLMSRDHVINTTLKSKKAYLLDNGKIKFTDTVSIKSNKPSAYIAVTNQLTIISK